MSFKNLLFVLISFFCFKAMAQDHKLSLELSYPLALGDNFYSENYTGYIDVGAKYRLYDLSYINLGLGLNGSYFKNNKSEFSDIYDVSVYNIQPEIYASFNLPVLDRLHPRVGLGYSFVLFNGKSTDNPNSQEIPDYNDSRSGFNLKAGLAYDITDFIFVKVQYDFVKLPSEEELADIPYNTNVSVLKFGIGVGF